MDSILSLFIIITILLTSIDPTRTATMSQQFKWYSQLACLILWTLTFMKLQSLSREIQTVISQWGLAILLISILIVLHREIFTISTIGSAILFVRLATHPIHPLCTASCAAADAFSALGPPTMIVWLATLQRNTEFSMELHVHVNPFTTMTTQSQMYVLPVTILVSVAFPQVLPTVWLATAQTSDWAMEPTRVLAWLAIMTVEDRLASNVTTPVQHVALEGQPIASLVHWTRSGTFLRTLADVSQDIMTLELSFVPSVFTLVRPA